MKKERRQRKNVINTRGSEGLRGRRRFFSKGNTARKMLMTFIFEFYNNIIYQKTMTSIIDEYVKSNKYLNSLSEEKLEELIEYVYDECYEFRAAGGYEDPIGYEGEEPYEGPITEMQAYDQLLILVKEMEQSATIIQRAMIRYLRK